MSSVLAFVLLQYVVSVKAGLVNHVQGDANVVAMDMVRAGHAVRTGADGYAEVLLTPGSFLRIGENSQTVLESVEFDNLHLVVLSGPAVIEVVDIARETPIRVTTGALEVRVNRPGIYRFADGKATVIKGKLETEDGRLAYEKGWEVFFEESYRARKTPKPSLTGVDVYSQKRSEMIALANHNMTVVLQPSYSYDAWMYAPEIGMYTYIPLHGFRSPYGYLYYAPRYSARRIYTTTVGTSVSVPDTTPRGRPTTDTGGGDTSSGGGGAAPAVTITTPSGQPSTPAVYIESKNSTAGQ